MNAVDPRAAPDFDVGALDAWLKDWLGGRAHTEAGHVESHLFSAARRLARRRK